MEKYSSRAIVCQATKYQSRSLMAGYIDLTSHANPYRNKIMRRTPFQTPHAQYRKVKMYSFPSFNT
jgi:hypothetical protein